MLSAYFDIKPARELPAPPLETLETLETSKPKESPSAPASASDNPKSSTKKTSKGSGSRKAKRGARPPVPSEAETTHIYAGFSPLPPETNVPRPAESASQAWHGLDASMQRADWYSEFVDEDDEGREEQPDDLMDMDKHGDDLDFGDRMSDCLEYEPESLDPKDFEHADAFALDDTLETLTAGDTDIDSSLGSSYDDGFMTSMFSSKSRGDWGAAHGMPVYSGPQLFQDAIDSDEDE